nr:hypothetical protein [Actinomycetota bacterium]
MASRQLRVFVSSPGDVGQERIIALRVLERLQGEFAGFVDLQPIFWEHEPLRATGHFQEQIVAPSSADIVICILWSRLGTRLPSQFCRPDGSCYASGTEWEFEDAVEAFRRTGKPDLLVYRKMADPQIPTGDEDAAIQRLQQKKALDAFIEHWFGSPQEGFKAAFHGFDAVDGFEELLDTHLRKLVRQHLPERLTDESGSVPITWFKGTPYRGLEAFDFEHAP